MSLHFLGTRDRSGAVGSAPSELKLLTLGGDLKPSFEACFPTECLRRAEGQGRVQGQRRYTEHQHRAKRATRHVNHRLTVSGDSRSRWNCWLDVAHATDTIAQGG
jgi:hypothetical protein